MMSAHATSFSLVWLKAANMAVANEQQWALEAVNNAGQHAAAAAHDDAGVSVHEPWNDG